MIRTSFLLLFLLLFSKCFSCECNALKPISKKLIENYNVVFLGKVDSVSHCGNDGISTAYFTINELYKGSVEQHIKVDFDCSSACLMSFEKNEQWLIYTGYQRFDLLTVNICEHSRKYFNDATLDFYFTNAQRTFEEEKQFLRDCLSLKPFVKATKINKEQNDFKPHNEQPSALTKLGLLLLSVVLLALIFFFLKKYAFKTKK